MRERMCGSLYWASSCWWLENNRDFQRAAEESLLKLAYFNCSSLFCVWHLGVQQWLGKGLPWPELWKQQCSLQSRLIRDKCCFFLSAVWFWKGHLSNVALSGLIRVEVEEIVPAVWLPGAWHIKSCGRGRHHLKIGQLCLLCSCLRNVSTTPRRSLRPF